MDSKSKSVLFIEGRSNITDDEAVDRVALFAKFREAGYEVHVAPCETAAVAEMIQVVKPMQCLIGADVPVRGANQGEAVGVLNELYKECVPFALVTDNLHDFNCRAQLPAWVRHSHDSYATCALDIRAHKGVDNWCYASAASLEKMRMNADRVMAFVPPSLRLSAPKRPAARVSGAVTAFYPTPQCTIRG